MKTHAAPQIQTTCIAEKMFLFDKMEVKPLLLGILTHADRNTHTHVHTCTHTYVYIHMYVYICTHTYKTYQRIALR